MKKLIFKFKNGFYRLFYKNHKTYHAPTEDNPYHGICKSKERMKKEVIPIENIETLPQEQCLNENEKVILEYLASREEALQALKKTRENRKSFNNNIPNINS